MTLGERERAAPAFFPLFDGLRAIAALLVVVVHAAFISGFTTHPGMWGALTARGEIGVSVFFLISGFLLYRPWAAAHLRGAPGPGTREFFVRRVLRIVPLYWVALTAFFLLDRFAGVQATGPKGVADLPVYFLFGQVYSKEHVLHGLTPAWTLCIEVTFYLLLPLYAAAVARGRDRRTPSRQLRREIMALALLIVGALGWRTVTLLTAGSMSNVVRAWLPSYADQFALGMLLAVVSAWCRQTAREPKLASRRFFGGGSWLLAAGCFLLVSSPLVGLPRVPVYVPTLAEGLSEHVLYGAFAFFLLLPAAFGPARSGWVRRLLATPVLAFLGLISYGIYLWHRQVLQLLWDNPATGWHLTGWPLFRAPFGPMFAIALLGTVAVSTLTYHLVERPAMAWSHGWVQRRRERMAGLALPTVTAPAIAAAPAAAPVTIDLDRSAPDPAPARVDLDDAAAAGRSTVPRRGTQWVYPAWAERVRARCVPVAAARFGALVAVISAVALFIRLGYAFGVARHVTFGGDSVWYHLVAAEINEGHGFVNPAVYYPTHQGIATAQFPPLYPAFLAVLDRVGLHSPFSHQLAGAVVGVAIVPLVALLARRVLGPALALAAAAVVAVEPTLVAADSAGMAETLAVPLLTLGVLLLYRARATARVRDWVAVGGAFGLVALTRSEGPILFVAIVGATLLLWKDAELRRRLVCGAAALAAVVAIMLPWTVRSSTALDGLVVSSTNTSTMLAGTYCDSAFSGPLAGVWDPACVPAQKPGSAEAPFVKEQLKAALKYAKAHATELPKVMALREGRVFGLYRPRQEAYYEAGETRDMAWQRFALIFTAVASPFLLAGLLALWRRRRPIGPLVAWLGTCLVLVALTQGANRQRLMFEPVLAILLAAVPLLLARRRHEAGQADVACDEVTPDERSIAEGAHTAAASPVSGRNARTPQPSRR